MITPVNEGTGIAELSAAIAARRISPVEITQACLTRIERLDRHLRTFITLDAERALMTARTLEAELAHGNSRGPLHGVPLAHKDLFAIPGLPSSCGTRSREYFKARRPATVITRLAAAGAITLGTLNMTELAMSPLGENDHHGDVQNPWRSGHLCGGSSSGSAAAVAAELVLGALGTDTGGSIRVPAACCGVVGLKPTYGRVSRAGAMPLSWSLDHVGPLTRTVRDAALLLNIIAGRDAADPTTSRQPVPDYVRMVDGSVAGVRVGVPDTYFLDGLNGEVESGVRAAVRVLEDCGVKATPVALPHVDAMMRVTHVISRSESVAVHATVLRERPDDLQPAVRTRLAFGFKISAHDYLQALRLRVHLSRKFLKEVFSRVDALVTPVIMEPAPTAQSVKSPDPDEMVARMRRFSRCTRPFNGFGLPALSVPCGFSQEGLPLAFQIVGRPFDEVTVLRIGHAYQQATRWFERRPALDGNQGAPS
jgi:aspartyl-tRNA(Asn)/glutamyl-tRNA(Gln) amidotransferase subunit A